MLVLALFFSLFLVGIPLEAQSYSKIEAEENFRLGVNSFHFGLYHQALLLFEKSLAFLEEKSDPPLRDKIYFWLGRAYYQNGNTAQALKSWATLIQQGSATSALTAFAEIVNGRYSLPPDNTASQLARFGYLDPGENALFQRPSALVQSPFDALRYLVDFADSSLLLLDINGKLVRKLKGTFQPIYQQPYDILFLKDGRFVISDFSSNQLIFHSAKGEVDMQRGEDAHLLGPQYLTATDDGYFYVSEWGHRRLVKWDVAGNEIFYFGDSAQPGFPGLISPTGVVANRDGVFVADAGDHSVHFFDHDGNHVNTLLKQQLDQPEGLLLGEEGQLLIADGAQILSYHFASKRAEVIYRGEAKSKYYRLSYDRNGHLMASDFINRRVELLMNEEELYSNLFVSVNRIYSDDFPQVELEVEVESHNGRAILDLVRENFSLFEDHQQVEPVFLGSLEKRLSVSFVASGPDFFHVLQRIEQGLTTRDELHVVINQQPLQVVNADQLPSLPNWSKTEQAELSQALRMGSDSLFHSSGRRVLIYFSQQGEKEEFTRYGLSEILQLLNNNNVSLLVVGYQQPRGALKYLIDNSRGVFIPFEQQAELSPYLDEQRNRPSHVYRIAYHSPKFRTLQNQYISSAVTVHYGQRSGRDESGYFPP